MADPEPGRRPVTEASEVETTRLLAESQRKLVESARVLRETSRIGMPIGTTVTNS